MSDFGRLKIVVVGDSGVGKTAFVYLVCHGEALLNPSWTIGCSVDMTVYPRQPLHNGSSSNNGGSSRRHFVEFWDIGGSSSHAISRGVFYENPHGVILVHDLTNKKSENHLSRWLSEVLSDRSSMPKVVAYSGDVHSCGPSKKSPLGASSPPVLVVGSKLDQVVVARDRSVNSHHNHLPLHVPRNGSVFACTYNLPELRLNCNSSSSLAEGSQNAKMVSDFLEQAIHFKKRDSISRRVEDVPSAQHAGSIPNLGNRFADISTYRMPNY